MAFRKESFFIGFSFEVILILKFRNMYTYLISYDLMKSGQDYSGLIKKIKELGTWWHCLDSTFIIKSNSNAVTIRDTLKYYIDNNDKILVVRLQGEGAWSNFDYNCAKWLEITYNKNK